jgi:UDP-N-acetylmuramoylalanine--D-glutamate ligase
MNQKNHDYLLLNYDQEITKKIGEEDLEVNVIYFSLKNILKEGVYVKDNEIIIKDGNLELSVCKVEDILILGDHNIENALAATAIAYFAGISIEVIAKSLKSFKGVEHRIEYVRTINDVKFYNDSKGTNPEATIKAIQAMTGDTVLIAGGMDKGSNFDSLIESFGDKVTTLVVFGETKNIIEEAAKKNSQCEIFVVDTLNEAIMKSVDQSKPGDSILLSPACASWDMYESYEHRGQEFKSIVLEL